MSKLDPALAKIIATQADNNPVSHFFKHKDKLSFEVGDYLIRMKSVWTANGTKLSPETISDVSAVYKRYQCIHKDEHDICYIQGLSSKGEPLPYVSPLIEWYENNYFTLDPSYADHIIFNGNEPFDTSKDKKKERSRRDKITRDNKKIALKFNDEKEILIWWNTIKVGDSIRYGEEMPKAVNKQTLEVKTVQKRNESRKSYHSYKPSISDKELIVLTKSTNREYPLQVEELFKKYIFHNIDPIPYEDPLT